MCYNEYTQYTIFNIKKETILNYPKSAGLRFFQDMCTQERVRGEFETAVVNEPSVFEPLKLYSNCIYIVFYSSLQITTMHRLILGLFLATAILLLSVTCQPDAMLAPPGRPAEFRTPDQLRRYLKALNDYYAIVGRPR